MGDEGYILQVRPDGIRLRTHEAKGVYYGIQALLAAIDDETTVPSEAAAPCCQIGDWPTFPFRGISCANPTNRWGYPNDPSYEVGDFNDFIYRTVARLKMNKVVFIVPEGMQFDSHPELSAPNAWSKDELRQFVDFAREHYIEVIPLVTVLGHASWFTVTHKELVEPANDHNIACVRLPETNALIADVMAEVVEVFEPEMVHLGMDECWWKTLDKPEEERCPRCGEDWPQIVAQQATFFHDLLAEKGIRTMMWDDMLLPEHNGGAPYHTARALGGIPTDMVITNWSAGLAPNSSKRFADAGLTVIRSNSHGIPRAEAPYVIGNMMGLWSKIPWLTDTYHKTSATYSYLALPQAAEFSWNVDPKLTSRGIDRDMLAERADSVMRRIALQPSPNVGAEQTAIDLTEAFNGDAKGLSALDDGETEIAGVGFEVTYEAVTVADDPVTVPVGAEAAEIDLLVSCDLARGEWEEFTKRFREKDGNLGVLIGTVEFALSDGTTEALELRYG
ncbi:MAG TPA: family 20 glycosylhydrolase, partial [Armatimonadota bacterium]|nr:family 20 glycosylhydrolase [Armatimonadota bacterium]